MAGMNISARCEGRGSCSLTHSPLSSHATRETRRQARRRRPVQPSKKHAARSDSHWHHTLTMLAIRQIFRDAVTSSSVPAAVRGLVVSGASCGVLMKPSSRQEQACCVVYLKMFVCGMISHSNLIFNALRFPSAGAGA